MIYINEADFPYRLPLISTITYLRYEPKATDHRLLYNKILVFLIVFFRYNEFTAYIAKCLRIAYAF
jgi:hypothetical protein